MEEFKLINVSFIFLMIFISLFLNTKALQYFNLQSAVLSNLDFLFVHKYGIDIVNYDINVTLRREIIFTEEEEITDEKMKDIIIKQFDDFYIICLINNNIYIFDDLGHFLIKHDNISLGKNVEYYSLNIKDNYHYFIGILTNDSLNLYYYEYNKTEYSNTLIASNENIKIVESEDSDSFTYYNFEKSGLNCHMMNSPKKGETLACFMILSNNNNYYWYIGFYYISDNSIINNSNYTSLKTKITNKINFFKVDVRNISDIALICFIDISRIDRCFNFNIEQTSINLNYIIIGNISCQNEYYKFKINYYEPRNEFLFSCIGYEKSLKYVLFYYHNGEYLLGENYYFITEEDECQKLNGYTFFFEGDYYIVFDYICS